eukprot:TRINITY_DN21026_c0_g1_i1.p1 TRINITY_DN21026_c0_g1~~TRINITY_DN21026_c0_g1_i1.p1  ORF type:complete len:259 (-),score=34.86 TRINITY_DN21026_c0_g1_i1:27-803(-)
MEPIDSSERDSQRRILQSSRAISLKSFPLKIPVTVFKTEPKLSFSLSVRNDGGADGQNSVTVKATTSEGSLPVKNLPEPLVIPIPKRVPSPVTKAKSTAQPFVCKYYDVATRSFRSEGCSFLSEDIKYIYCGCSHLTEITFGMNSEAEVVPVSQDEIRRIAAEQIAKDEQARRQSDVSINANTSSLVQTTTVASPLVRLKVLISAKDLLLQTSTFDYLKFSNQKIQEEEKSTEHKNQRGRSSIPVSYTHLTLPTIYSV